MIFSLNMVKTTINCSRCYLILGPVSSLIPAQVQTFPSKNLPLNLHLLGARNHDNQLMRL